MHLKPTAALLVLVCAGPLELGLAAKLRKESRLLPTGSDDDVLTGLVSQAEIHRSTTQEEEQGMMYGREDRMRMHQQMRHIRHSARRSVMHVHVVNHLGEGECDPQAEEEVDESVADDLSYIYAGCAEGYTCVQSDVSSMGGSCVPLKVNRVLLPQAIKSSKKSKGVGEEKATKKQSKKEGTKNGSSPPPPPPPSPAPTTLPTFDPSNPKPDFGKNFGKFPVTVPALPPAPTTLPTFDPSNPKPDFGKNFGKFPVVTVPALPPAPTTLPTFDPSNPKPDFGKNFGKFPVVTLPPAPTTLPTFDPSNDNFVQAEQPDDGPDCGDICSNPKSYGKRAKRRCRGKCRANIFKAT